MKSFSYVIKDEMGIHARPAGSLVKFVGGLTSAVTLQKGEKTVDAKKLFAIMSLGAKCGDELVFNLEGENVDVDAAALEAFCSENF